MQKNTCKKQEKGVIYNLPSERRLRQEREFKKEFKKIQKSA